MPRSTPSGSAADAHGAKRGVWLREAAMKLSRAPFTGALLLTFCFVLLSLIYIIVSDRIVLDMASDERAMAQLQTLKGIGYVVVVGLFGFGLFYLFLALVEQAHREHLRISNSLVSAERLATAGTLAASVAHDINNLLAGLILQMGAGREGQAERDSLTHQILEEIGNLSNRLMRGGGEDSAGQWVELPCRMLVDESMELISSHAAMKTCRVNIVYGDAVDHVRILQVPFRQLLVNLLLNGAESAGSSGNVRLTLDVDGGELVVRVEDSGAGVPGDLRDKLFKECFTTKRRGHGLGLLSVKASAELHGGTVAYGESDLGGARFECRLPVVVR